MMSLQRTAASVVLFGLLLTSCAPSSPPASAEKKILVVTYSVLGALVKELVGEPSAKDIETLNRA